MDGAWPPRRAAQLARPFLQELGLPQERIDDICYGIAIHVDDQADFPGTRTTFALSVGDADNIDRFDAYRIHETLSWDGFLEKSLEEKRTYVSQRLARLQRCRQLRFATEAAQTLWDERVSFYQRFFEKLKSQLACSDSLAEEAQEAEYGL